MERILEWKIDDTASGTAIEAFLRSRGCSHHVLTHLKRTENGIIRNGRHAWTNEHLAVGDLLQIRILETESSPGIIPVPLPLSVCYEDEDLMVINKPSDTPIHPSIHNYDNTLANGVMYYFSSKHIPFVYRCINRLDRDTSGLLIIAKNMMSGAILSRMSASRQIHRTYLAVVEGVLPESGTIDAPIAREEDSAIMRCVDPEHGESAVTHYHRLGCYTLSGVSLSLASVHLETGRTHQIRVHMKHIGHPLIGDFLYHPDSLHLMNRQALHSHMLAFHHPITGELLSFTCDIPDDMQQLLKQSDLPLL